MKNIILAAIFLGGSAFAQSCVAERLSCNQGGVVYNAVQTGQLPSGIGIQVPSGMILLTLAAACPTGFSEVTALNGKFVLGTVAANSNVGTTGGSATITPAGTNAATSATPAGTIAWPASVPTNATASFTPAGTNASITAGTPAGTNASVSAGTPAGTVSAIAASATAANVVTAGSGTNDASSVHTHPAPTFAGSALGTHTHVFTGSALATHTHVFTGSAGTVPAQVVSWPVAVPLFSGASLTIPPETFTGTPVNPAPPYVVVIFCSKN